MDPALVMTLQLMLAFAGFAMIALWHAGPALRKYQIEDALALLCVFHAFRYVALAIHAPGDASSLFAGGRLALTVAGDVTPAALSIIAALMLHARTAGAMQAAWVFNLVGLADMLVSGPIAMSALIERERLGFGWPSFSSFVFIYYVPALLVTHVMMLNALYMHADRRPQRVRAAA